MFKAIRKAIRAKLQPDEETPIEEATKQRVEKSAKMQTALEGVFVNSFHKLDQDERDVVNEYRNRQMGATAKRPHKRETASGPGKYDDLIVADDITTTTIDRRGLGVLGTLALAAAVAGPTGVAVWAMTRDKDNPTDNPVKTIVEQTDYSVDSRVIVP